MFVAINSDFHFNPPAFLDDAQQAAAADGGVRKAVSYRSAVAGEARGSNAMPILLGPARFAGTPAPGAVQNTGWNRKARRPDGCVLTMLCDDSSWRKLDIAPTENMLFQLHEDVLELIVQGCKHLLEYGRSDWLAATNATDKLRITMEAASTIILCRRTPSVLLRRTDFVPWERFSGWSLCSLREQGFKQDETQWLTQDSSAPPVQVWPGRTIEGAGYGTLICLFARSLKDQTWHSIQNSPVEAKLTAGAVTADTLAAEGTSNRRGASAHKGHVLWLVRDDDLTGVADEHYHYNSSQWIDHRTAKERFAQNFQKGTLHVVKSSDVTNRKLVITPDMFTGRRRGAHDQALEEGLRAGNEAPHGV